MIRLALRVPSFAPPDGLKPGDRRQALREGQALGLCNITKCCTEVCPAGIKITDNAIIAMKEPAG